MVVHSLSRLAGCVLVESGLGLLGVVDRKEN